MAVWQLGCCLVTQLCPALCWTICWLFDIMGYITSGFPVLHCLLEFAQIHVHWYYLTIHSLPLPFFFCLQCFPLSVFSSESALCIRRLKYWSLSFSISPSNKYSGLISFRIDWLDLLAVQGTSRVFSSTTVQKHQFFSTQSSLLSNSHIHTWLLGKCQLWLYKFCWQTTSLFYNMLSMFVIAFLLRSKHLLISWLQSLSEVIQDPKKIKSVTVSTVSPSICHRMMDQMPLFSFLNVEFLSQLFHSSLSLSSRGSLVPLTFCLKGGVIWVPEVIDISPGNLDSILCFFQPGILHDELCM